MKRFVAALAIGGALAGPAFAELSPGAAAPDFTTQATLGGKQFTFTLSEALKKGPVVVYFYPKAFTSGCTVEAHEFASNIDKYKALHATVIGISHDGIATLDKFSVSDCASKFALGSDPDLKIARGYDSVLLPGFAKRASYVIAPGGKVLYAYTDMNPAKHVENTLQAIKTYEDAHS